MRYRTTILSANPIGQLGYETQIAITLLFQDILTLADIDDTSTSFAILNDTGTPWVYSINWQPATSSYLLLITTVGQTTLTLGDHALWLNMSYANVDPFYRWDDVYVQFTIRTRTSALDLQEAEIPAPFGENVSFVVYYWDADVTAGISGADFILEESVLLTPDVDYFVVEGLPGVYTIYIDSAVLGALGSHDINVTAVWPGGAPYHNNAQRDVTVSTVRRTATVDILEPANQPRYLDNITFTFAYIDSINGLQIPGITSSEISIYSNGTLLSIGDYVLTPVGSTFIVIINSTILSANLVNGFNVTVFVNWNDGTSPFYTDDGTSMKVSTTQRIILVEPQQIETTPVHDSMNVTFILVDEDNGNPVSGAIILFRCVNPSRTLNEGSEYTLIEIGAGVYEILIDTDALVFGPGDIGDFIFELEVQWNQNNQPFYKNKSPISLTGTVDLIWANMQSSVQTPTVQITDYVTINITLTDLDHVQGIANTSIPNNVINVHYYGTSIVPDSLTITYHGSGIFSIKFSTIDLNDFGVHSVNITIDYYPYTSMIVNPSFIVTEIATSLIPWQIEMILSWTELANITVDYNDLLNLNLTSGASLNWTYGSANGTFIEIGTTGTYYAIIDTSLADSGTEVVRIYANKDKYQFKITSVTLVVLALPSDIVLIDTGSPDVNRGESISFSIRLNDTERVIWINNTQVIAIYATLEGVQYPLTWDGVSSTWNGTIPSSATVLDPGSYEIRFTVTFKDYQTAGDQFRVSITRTGSELTVRDYETGELLFDIEAVYSQLVRFSVNLTEFENNTLVSDATIYWYSSDFNGLNLTFTYNSTTQLWDLEFNTTLGFYGTWGLTIRAFPTDPILAPATATLTLTISKITTEVQGPTLTKEVDWGWTGNISFTYYDTAFDRGIENATVLYDYGTFTGLQAHDLGNGTYLLFINTTYLTSDAQYRIIVDLQKDNFEERTSGANLFVQLRDTELIVSVDDVRTYQNTEDVTNLQVPMGDSTQISFFFNDTSSIGGLFGGLDFATIQASFAATDYFPGTRNVTAQITRIGEGWYVFEFDTNNLNLYEYNEFEKIIQSGQFFLTVRMESLNRVPQEAVVRISIIVVPTIIQYTGDTVFNSLHLDEITIQFTLYDTWHDVGIVGAQVISSGGQSAIVKPGSNRSLSNGVYEVTIQVVGTAGDNIIHLLLVSNFIEEIELQITVTANPNDTDILIGQVTQIGLPISLLVITLLGLYVRVWSVPKRIRQINGQIKNLRKGKVPKPVGDVKSRQELVADLFNDTFDEMKIKRTAEQMPEVSVPIEVPEIRDLLIQLSILTHLTPTELDEFISDISKMKMSEQAAFVREVISQEAIRAARTRGMTVEEILEELADESSRRISATDEVIEAELVPEEPFEERVFLPEDETVTEEPETEVETPKVEEKAPTEKLSQFELEELKAELIRKGVPNHEINMIIEQARHLSRELVDELVKSLGLKE
ncbi:MAG: hypothetical protein E3J86_15355 [Candidatus Thorarchaeota archaeon]|nr:MAG: hypothetical protein E3J86_15355 [Candidatus Thorarchaeota archaeon]